MSTIVFTMLPETGHVNASLKIARSLKARGHRVVFLGLKDFEDYIIGQGLEFIPMMADQFPKGFLRQHSFTVPTLEVLVSMLGERLKGESMTAFDVLRAEVNFLIKELRPDLVISDALLAEMAFIIRSSRVPLVLLNSTLFYPWEADNAVTNPLQNLTTMFLCPHDLDFPHAKKRDNHHYVEASIDLDRKEVEFSFDHLNRDKRLIYCSLGSQAHLYPDGKKFLQTVIDVMPQKIDCQMILVTGPNLDRSEFRAAPPNVFLVETAPQLQILQRASLMITHGGLNSIKECIFFGVPMIVFPMDRDQPLNAARVVYHGLGVRGDLQTLNADNLLGMMDKVERDPAFKSRVEKMRGKFRQMEGAQISIKIIEKALDASPASRVLTRQNSY